MRFSSSQKVKSSVVSFSSILLLLFSFNSWSQSVLLDDFNRPDNNTVGLSWVETQTVSPTSASVNTNVLRMSSATAGRDYVTYDVSAMYNTVLSSNTGLLEWAFNMRQSRADPSGFDAGNYGIAFVLGATSGNFLTASGYAVVLGNSGSGDNLRLVSFASGVASNLGLSAVINPANDFGAEYLTVKVTYNPVGNVWTLYLGTVTASFVDPAVATYNTIGSASNSTYTSLDLMYLGCLWNHATGATEAGTFDNIRIPTACIIDTQPTTQASALNFTSIGASSMTLNWTRGNGTECIIIARSGSAVTAVPVDGAVYSANTTFGNGTQISAGEYVVYSGSANTISITGLNATTTYYFSIYEFNGNGCTSNFLTGPATGNATTIGCVLAGQPTVAPGGLTVSSTMSNSMNVTWTRGNGAYCIVICRGGSAVTSAPVDGTGYTSNATYGLGSTTTPGDYIVYSGTGTSVNVLGLMPGTAYFFSVYEMNGTGCNTNYLITFTNATSTTNPVVAYTTYFGNLHSHSDYSDGDMDNVCNGAGSPDCCYTIGNTASYFDFMGISDHNHNEGPIMTPALYASGVSEASTYSSVNPGFAALYGMEWGTISTGGHVAIYGVNQLIGWNSGNYNIFVAKGDYNGLFNVINNTSGAFATLCHPNNADYGNLLGSAYNAAYDNAIVGVAIKNGPYSSTNVTYSDPATSTNINYWNSLLGKGYHLGPTMDLDNHNSITMGKSSQARTAILAPSMSVNNVMEAMLNMRFYATEDYNLGLTYNINGIFPLGSIVTQTVDPTLNVTTSDGNGETITQIRIFYGVPGSNAAPTVLTTVSGSSLNYTHTFASGTYYYYAEVTQSDGQKAWTSPIWYTKIVTPLPIELLSFTGEYTSKGNLLKWVTATEINNNYFTVERSIDGKNFKSIGQVKGAGNSSRDISYNYLDVWAPEGINYYRLRQNDFDDNFTYSNIIALRSHKKDELFLVFPNPATESFIVSVKEFSTDGYDLTISNSLGQVVFDLKNIYSEQMKLSPALNDGVYTISFVLNNEIYNKKLIIRRD